MGNFCVRLDSSYTTGFSEKKKKIQRENERKIKLKSIFLEDNEPYVTRMDAKIRSSCSSALKEKTHNEKRVDFNVTVCEEPPHNPPKNASHSLPKSSLKHFSIDTRG